MFDFPIDINQIEATKEHVLDVSDRTEITSLLNEIDLSFYEDLGAGFCSGESSSSAIDRIKGSCKKII